MVKRTIHETVKEYDDNGKLVRETTTETVEEDESTYIQYPIPSIQDFSKTPYPYPPQITWTYNDKPPEVTL